MEAGDWPELEEMEDPTAATAIVWWGMGCNVGLEVGLARFAESCGLNGPDRLSIISSFCSTAITV